MPIPTFLPRKVSYQAVNTNIRPISKPSRVTPPRNQNINNSHSSTTKKNGRIKTTILTRVLIQPRPLSGKTQLRFNAKFDTSRAKALLSENVHDRFGSMGVVTYPGLVGIEDANGDQINFMGEVTFKTNILDRVTTVNAWVTNEIPPGSLILGYGVLEDLNFTLLDIPDILSHSGRAEDTDTIKDPHGSSPVTRASKSRITSRDISQQENPPNKFLLPFDYGFRREIVVGGKGKRSAYYIAPDSNVRIKGKKVLNQHIDHLENITEANFTFTNTALPLWDPLNEYQWTRQADPSRRSTSRAIPQESYQSTNDSAQSAGETQQYQDTDHHWDQAPCWEQPEDVYIKDEFNLGPYNTESLRRDEWHLRKQISSDNTEEETVPYKIQNAWAQS